MSSHLKQISRFKATDITRIMWARWRTFPFQSDGKCPDKPMTLSSGRKISPTHRPIHNTQKKQTSMSPAGFDPAMSAGERPQTHALDRADTWIVYLLTYRSYKGIWPIVALPHVILRNTLCVQVLRSPTEAFAAAMQSWRQRCEKCVCLQGDYVEKRLHFQLPVVSSFF